MAWGENSMPYGDFGQCDIQSDEIFERVFAGHFTTAAMRSDGTVAFWGGWADEFQEAQGSFIDLAMGYGFCVGLRKDGTVECVGDGNAQPGIPSICLDVPTSLGVDGVITASEWHGYASGGGGTVLNCWRQWPFSKHICAELSVPEHYVQLSTKSNNLIALRNDGFARYWRNNTSPNYGFLTSETYSSVAAGIDFGIGIKSDGSIGVVEYGTAGVLNFDTFATDSDYNKIASGGVHVVALTDAGYLNYFGYHPSGQCLTPTQSRFIDVAAGFYHTVGLQENGRLNAWGAGLGTTDIPNNIQFTQIDAGASHNVGLLENGTVLAWGVDNLRQCWVPHALTGVQQVIAGDGVTLTLLNDGTLYRFGYGDSCGYLNPNEYRFQKVDAGGSHCLGILDNGSVFCWGENESACQGAPTGNNFIDISAGDSHSAALRGNGSAICWGSNFAGQCDVPEGEKFIQVTCGSNHSAGLTHDGRVVCWGLNNYGQCEPPEGVYTWINAGENHSVGLLSDGTAVAWGDNSKGQCDVPQGERFTYISAGGAHTVAVKAPGELPEIQDCNSNSIPDICERLDDCNFNEVPDACEIQTQPNLDYNMDGILDSCQCIADVIRDGVVRYQDLIVVISSWGPCDSDCPADVVTDGVVGYEDLLQVLAAWGPCSG